MKASFFKRMGAFILDYFIIVLAISLITVGFSNNKTEELANEMSKLLENYQKGEITFNDYKDKTYEINYELQKSNLTINVVSVTLYVGYFIIFATLNKGQTLGKKILKIKVVNKDGNIPSIWNMLLRSLFIYNIISALFSIIFVNLLNINTFTYIYTIIGYVEFFVIFVSFFMVTYRKDGRGLHDIIAGTNVIER